MPEPKFTQTEIEAEIVKLDGSGFNAAIYYLEAELHRRRRSSLNPGRKTENDSEKHQKWREAAAKYREKKRLPGKRLQNKIE